MKVYIVSKMAISLTPCQQTLSILTHIETVAKRPVINFPQNHQPRGPIFTYLQTYILQIF